jgi:hypothetical protein
MSQNHFTLSFSLKTPKDAKVLAEQLPPLMPQLFQAADGIGTIHYSRFTVLSEKTLLFLGDFDGEFGELMSDLARHAGPVFDAIFEHVDSPPSTPVADHSETFIEWTAAHLVHPLNIYTAYPGITAKSARSSPEPRNELNWWVIPDPVRRRTGLSPLAGGAIKSC